MAGPLAPFDLDDHTETAVDDRDSIADRETIRGVSALPPLRDLENVISRQGSGLFSELLVWYPIRSFGFTVLDRMVERIDGRIAPAAGDYDLRNQDIQNTSRELKGFPRLRSSLII